MRHFATHSTKAILGSLLLCVLLIGLNCKALALSDLVPQSITVQNSVTVGQQFNVSWQLRNLGDTAADAQSITMVRFTQSADSPHGTNLAAATATALTSGTVLNQSVTLTAPITPGTYYVWVIADVNKSVKNQSNTANDVLRSQSVTVRAITSSLPKITSVGSPVIGSNQPQTLSIFGTEFVKGASIRLQNLKTGQLFTNPTVASFSGTQIDLTHVFTSSPATWSVQVTNPGNSGTSVYLFPVMAPSARKETPAVLRDGISLFEVSSAVLHIPAIEVEGNKLWVDLKYDGKSHAVLLASGTALPDAKLAAWYNPATKVAEIPYVALGTGTDLEQGLYVLKMSLDTTRPGATFKVDSVELRHLELLTYRSDDGSESVITTNQRGSQFAIFGENIAQTNGTVHSATYLGDLGEEITVFLNESGLPEAFVNEDMAILFSNYTSTTVDLTIRDENSTSLIKQFPLPPELRGASNRSSSPLTLTGNAQANAADIALGDLADEMRLNADAIRRTQDMIGHTSCEIAGAAATTLAAPMDALTGPTRVKLALATGEFCLFHKLESQALDWIGHKTVRNALGMGWSFIECFKPEADPQDIVINCSMFILDAGTFVIDTTADLIDIVDILGGPSSSQQVAAQVIEQRGGTPPVIPTIVAEIEAARPAVDVTPAISKPFDSDSNPAVSQGTGVCAIDLCSHKGALFMAWDYPLALGSAVEAVADGEVIDWRDSVVDSDSCAGIDNATSRPDCWTPQDKSSLGGGSIGNVITIRHTVNGRQFYATYMHLRKDSIPAALKVANARVSKGDVIANVGNTGARTGTHLHYQVSSSESGTTNFGGADIANAVDNQSNRDLVAFLEKVQQAGPKSNTSDLVPRDVSIPTVVKPGETFAATWRIHNSGMAAAAASTTLAMISSSPTGTTHQGSSVTRHTAKLESRASVLQNANLAAPTVVGTYYLLIKADNHRNVANQSDYGNDTTTIAFAVADNNTVVATPGINAVSAPVKGSNSPQPFTIYGENFRPGATVTLRDHRTGEVFLNRSIVKLSNDQITINPRFSTAAATWSVEVINPGNASSGSFVFDVLPPTGAADPTSDSTFSISPAAANVDEGSTVTFTVTRDAATKAEQVYFSTTLNGNASSNDYTGIKDRALSFAIGVREQQVQVTTVDDSLNESHETFGVIIQRSPHPSPNVYLAAATFTIIDNDGAASLAPSMSGIAPTTIPASNSQQTIALFGANFVGGSTLEFDPPSGLNITSTAARLTFVSASRIEYRFNNDNDAGTWRVRVINPNGLVSAWMSFPVVSETATPAVATPSISYVSPSSIAASSSLQPLTIIGSGFVSGATLEFDPPSGPNITSTAARLTFPSTSRIEYQLNNDNDNGNWRVRVINPGGSASSWISFAVEREAAGDVALPAPSITQLSPSSMPALSSLQTLAIVGNNFVVGATLEFDPPSGGNINSAASGMNFVSSGRIDYQTNNANDHGTWRVRIINPDGKTSDWASFTVESAAAASPAPATSSVTPSSLPASNSQQTITIRGSDFVNGAALEFDPPSGSNINSSSSRLGYVSNSRIDYEINNGNDTGSWRVRVINPDGQASGWISFVVEATASAATPSIGSVSPSSLPASSARQTISISGSSFVSGATLEFDPASGGNINSSASRLSFVSGNRIDYDLNNDNDDGTWRVRVINPDGKASSWASFVVTPSTASTPSPSLSSVSPTSIPASTSRQTITISGSSFVSGATLEFDPPSGSNINSSASRLDFRSGSRIDYELNNDNDDGTWRVRVINPDGKSSGWGSFSVKAATAPSPSIDNVSPSSLPASNSQQTITINGSNFVNGARLEFDPPSGSNIPSTTSRLTFQSSRRIDYRINNGSDKGTWRVRIINPDGKTSGWESFRVQ